MKDLRKMIENLSKRISWEQEELGKELARVAEKANEDRETSYYLVDGKNTLINSLKIKRFKMSQRIFVGEVILV